MFKTRKIVPIVNLRSEKKNRNALSIYFLLHIQFTVVIGLGPILAVTGQMMEHTLDR